MINNIRHIFHKEDFTISARFPVGYRPGYPWRMVFNTTDKAGYEYICSFDGQRYTNAKPDTEHEDRVWLIFHNHGLPTGLLHQVYHREVPNDLYPDGFQHRAQPIMEAVELWKQPTDVDPTPHETLCIVEPLIKGNPGYTPVRGVDYFTDKDVSELAAKAAEQVPAPDIIGPIGEHNTSFEAHNDIREEVRNRAEAVKTYTAVVNTVAWRIQPTIEGPLNSAFNIWREDYYYVTLKDVFGTALPHGQFRLTPSLTADRTTADPTKAIDQTFMLPDLNTGNAGALTESAPVDFLTTGSDWQLRSAGVSSIKIGIDDEYIQGYDLNIFATTKVYKYGFMQYIPLESLDKSGEIGQNYYALSGFGNGYDFSNQFLFDSPTYVSSSARKHMFSNEVFRLRILPTAFLVEYSRSQMGFDGTLNNRLSVRNITSDTIRANGVGFSLDERNYPVSVLKLRSKIGITGGSNPFLNGSSFRIELIKRT